jgi:hypothetical protein
VFGAGAEINAAGVVATTMNVSDAEYMSGSNSLKFTGNAQGQIINKGKLKVNNINGYIALMAPQVINEGVVVAKISGANSVALVAGKNVTLNFGDGQLLNFNIDASVINALISNKRLIKTEGGQVIIAANSASDLKSSVLNNTGTVSASAIVSSGGNVSLQGDTINQAGVVNVNGGLVSSRALAKPDKTNSGGSAKTITTKAQTDAEKTANGGQITLKGNTVNVLAGSVTSAKGVANGGTINVGTSGVTYTQNADGTRTNVSAKDLAQTVTVQAGAVMDASSVIQGNGGQINVWSSQRTTVAGTFNALGGKLGGNGGFVETSSLAQLVIAPSATVNTSAPLGKKGNWLLDPDGLVIDSSMAAAISKALETANVTVAVQGDLTVSSDASVSALTGAMSAYNTSTLTLNASGALTNNGALSLGQNGSLVLNANTMNLNSGSVTSANQVTATAQSISASGSVSSTGGGSGGVNLLGGSVLITGNISANGTSSGGTSSSSAGGGAGSSSSGSGSGSSGSGSGTSGSSSTSSSTSTQSNTVTGKSPNGNSAPVSPASAQQLLTAITGAKAAAASTAAVSAAATLTVANSPVVTNTQVVNINMTNMPVSLNAAIISASAAASNGTTTYINVAAGVNAAGMTQPAINLIIGPQTVSSTATPNVSVLASGGSVNIQASQNLVTTAGSSISANAFSPAGSASTTATQTVSSAPTSTTSTPIAGSISLRVYDGTAKLNGAVASNHASGQGGQITVVANDLAISGSVQTNGSSGGSVYMTATSGSAKINNATVSANGYESTGGKIQIAGQNSTEIVASTLSVNGSSAGGGIQLGINNTTGSGSTLAPPASVAFSNGMTLSDSTSLDSNTLITANAGLSASATISSNPTSSLIGSPTQGGQVFIAANSALLNAANVQANADNGGLIVLSSPAGTYQNTGYIQTNGGAGLGGTIAQSGFISTKLSGAMLEANGTTSGGNIIIGRDFKTNPLVGSSKIAATLIALNSIISLPTSSLTTIDATTRIMASSTETGNGGNILIWGDSNSLSGVLLAQALGSSGSGGFIETSGKSLRITESAVVKTTSQRFKSGIWLLDPFDFYVAPSGGNITGAALTAALSSNSVIISAAAGCTSVTCTPGTTGTQGNIYINDSVYWSANTLTLNAGYNIYVGTTSTTGSLTVSGSGSLVLMPSDTTITGFTAGGQVFMGMASDPTSGLSSGYLGSGGTFSTGASTGFNGQINVSTTGTITISGNNYSVINSEADFRNLGAI